LRRSPRPARSGARLPGAASRPLTPTITAVRLRRAQATVFVLGRDAPPPVAGTVGQVGAEAIKLYQANLVPALALGLPVAAVDQLAVDRSLGTRIVLLLAASPVFSVAYAAGCAIRQ